MVDWIFKKVFEMIGDCSSIIMFGEYSDWDNGVDYDVDCVGLMERVVFELWKNLLGIDELDCDVDFVDVGGDLFFVIRFVMRLCDDYGIEFLIVDLLNYCIFCKFVEFIFVDKEEGEF